VLAGPPVLQHLRCPVGRPTVSQFENKPKLEVNKIALSVIRIINEYRNNRVTVDFTSKDGQPNDKLG
jgi:hypothetical protein